MRPSQAFDKDKAKRRRNRFYLQIELSALLAVMVVLLFIFMFGEPLGQHSRGIPVDLAMTEHAVPQPGARREDAIQVGVTKDGSVYLNGSKVEPENLPQLILDAVHDGAERKVYVKADSRAKYGDVSRALDQIKRSGISDVTFLVEGHERF